MWEECYGVLNTQTKYFPWRYTFTIKKYTKSKIWTRIKTIIEIRLQTALSKY